MGPNLATSEFLRDASDAVNTMVAELEVALAVVNNKLRNGEQGGDPACDDGLTDALSWQLLKMQVLTDTAVAAALDDVPS